MKDSRIYSHKLEIFCCYCKKKEVLDVDRLLTLIDSINYLKSKENNLNVKLNIYNDSSDSFIENKLNDYYSFYNDIEIFKNNQEGKYRALIKHINKWIYKIR